MSKAIQLVKFIQFFTLGFLWSLSLDRAVEGIYRGLVFEPELLQD